jgi:hypothetical protein
MLKLMFERSQFKQVVFIVFFFLMLSGCGVAQSDPEREEKENKPVVDNKPVLDSVNFKARMISMANGDSTGKWKFADQSLN